METAPCGLCGQLAREPVLTKRDRYGQTVSLVVCRGCGLRRLDPRLTDAEQARFYASDYYLRYAMDEKRARRPGWVAKKQRIAREILDAIEVQRPLRGLRLLDVGAGHGFLAEQARARGARVSVAEPSQRQAAELRDRGFETHAMDLAACAASRPLPFDVVTLSHILEHVNRPLEFLRLCRGLVAPAGLLCVEVPNTPWQTRHGDHPLSIHAAHVYYHSERTLRALLARAGWRAVATSFGLGGRSVRVVAEPAPPQALESLELDDPAAVLAETRAALRRLRPPLAVRLARGGAGVLRRALGLAPPPGA